MKRLLVFMVSVMLISCGVKKSSVNPVISTTIAPALNEINDADIGVTLVSKETGPTFDAIEITKEFKIKLHDIVKIIEVGTTFINDYDTKRYDLYSHSSDSAFGIAIPINGVNPLIYTSHDNDGIYTASFNDDGYNFLKPHEKIEYILTKVSVKDKEYFKQEFIYNGRVADALKFIYREYINDYARPAFKQDLQYDLSESDTIGFRGLRIQIINATNTKIEYKVLNYFDK